MKAIVIAIACGACYDPRPEPCTIACEPSDPTVCPLDLECLSDHRCHESAEEALCTFPVTITIDDPQDKKDVAHVAAMDTDLDCPDTCSIEVTGGQHIKLALVDKVGPAGPGTQQSVFVAFTGDCTARNRCELEVVGPTEVTAGLRAGRSVDVSLEGSGRGVVSSDPPGIQCTGFGSDCNEVFASDEAFELTATPESPAVFKQWIDAPGCDTDVDCKFQRGTDVVDAKARFDAIKVTTVVIPPDEGTITIDNAPEFRCTSVCPFLFAPTDTGPHTFTAVTNGGFVFDHLSSSPTGACGLPPGNECTAALQDNLVVISFFIPPSVTIDLSGATNARVFIQTNNSPVLPSDQCDAPDICTFPRTNGDLIALSGSPNVKVWNTCPDTLDDQTPLCTFKLLSEHVRVTPTFP